MLNWMERKMGWIAFPSIIRYLAMFQLGVLGLTFIKPSANQLLNFNWQAILEGEVWRILTFIFVPIGTLAGAMGSMTAIFAFFAAMLMMLFSDGIEERIGVFRTTLFFIAGWLVCLLASLLMSTTSLGLLGVNQYGTPVTVVDMLPPGLLFDATILFAFATFYPRYKIMLFFILPVPIAIIAGITGVTILLNLQYGVGMGLYIFACLANYITLVTPALQQFKGRQSRAARQLSMMAKEECFHSCQDCGKRDIDDPAATFRITAEGDELCEGCLRDRKKAQE